MPGRGDHSRPAPAPINVSLPPPSLRQTFTPPLTAEGAQVALMGRRTEPLEAVANESGGLVVQADAASSEQVGVAMERIRADLGPLDVMVCNAGGFGFGTLTDTNDEDWN